MEMKTQRREEREYAICLGTNVIKSNSHKLDNAVSFHIHLPRANLP